MQVTHNTSLHVQAMVWKMEEEIGNLRRCLEGVDRPICCYLMEWQFGQLQEVADQSVQWDKDESTAMDGGIR